MFMFKVKCQKPVCFQSAPPNQIITFLADFSELLSSTVLNHGRINIVGDVNIHIDDPSHHSAREFLNITHYSFNLV